MSPTPEAISQSRERYEKEIEPLRNAILGTVEAVKKSYCLRENISEDFFLFRGFIFDLTPRQSKEEPSIQTLHPVFMISGGELILRVFCGTDFTEERTVTSGKEALVEWAKNMQEEYPMFSSEAPAWTGLSVNDGIIFVGRQHRAYLKTSDDLELFLAKGERTTNNQDVEKQMIVALANAAGIKPEDEKSETFPLLLRELKRIKAEEGK